MQIRYVLDTITHLNDGSAALVAFSEAEALFPTHPLQHFTANITTNIWHLIKNSFNGFIVFLTMH